MNSFSVQATDISLVGVYTGLQVKVTLLNYPDVVPIYSAPFDVTIADPCLTVTLTPSVIADITTTVLADPDATSTFAPFTDSVSTSNAGVDMCGPIEYSVTSVSPKRFGTATSTEISFDPTTRTITASPTLEDHVDDYTVVVEAKLTDYPGVVITETMTVIVDPCVLMDFIVSEIQNQVYLLGSPALILTYPAVSLIP